MRKVILCFILSVIIRIPSYTQCNPVYHSGVNVYTCKNQAIATFISSRSNKQVDVSLTGEKDISKNGTVNYRLVKITTGAIVTSGKINANGGALNFSNVESGIYILQISSENGTVESFKIII